MNEFLRKISTSLSNFWKTASVVKKVILFAIIAVIVVAIVVTANVSSAPSGVRLFNTTVKDETLQDQILTYIDTQNIKAYLDNEGYIRVPTEKEAKKLKPLLDMQGLLPPGVDPFADFYNRTWSTTDKEQNVKLKNAMTTKLQTMLESMEDIQKATLSIVLPKKEIFSDNQDPVTASVVITPAQGSDIKTNRKKAEALEKLLLHAIQGLKHEGLTIQTDDAVILNDFEGLKEGDRLSLIERQQKLKKKLEAEKRADLLKALQAIKGEDRIRDVAISIDFDMSERKVQATEYSGITLKPDNPNTPYDDSETVQSIPISEQTVNKEWTGTGFNPEGPAGVEGQTPPVYSDMSNVVGKSTEKGVTRNNAINEKHIEENTAPQTGRTTVSFNVDGSWRLLDAPRDEEITEATIKEGQKIDSFGKYRWLYTPVTAEELSQFETMAKGAIGYNQARGDSVSVTSMDIDRADEHKAYAEDMAQKEKNQRTLILILVVVAVLLIAFILFRVISKEMERRRRLREEELLRQQQAEREKALWESQNQAESEVTMSVEDSRRAELQEKAIAMAKEHAEDVAMLIRTWLMEE